MSRGWFAVVLVAACSTTPDAAPATVSGTIGGAAFTAGDAVVVVDPAQKSAKVVVTSTADACADIRAGVARQNTRVLLLQVIDDADAALTAGSFTTSSSDPPPARSALFESNVTDGQCNVSYDPPPDGTGDGIVTVTAVSGETIDGEFDVILENGEHITGTFHPTACPELAHPPTATSCVP